MNVCMLPGAADAADTPAPGDYHPLQECPRGPAWTLAGKTPAAAACSASSSTCEQPGPGHYTLPEQQGQGPAFSLVGKPSRGLCNASMAGGAAEEPGPGAYFVPEGVYSWVSWVSLMGLMQMLWYRAG